MAGRLHDVRAWRDRIREDLWARTLPFWLAHSVDQECGGFFNCLDADGAVFDTTKHVWLQGRQCWMFARIANEYSDAEFEALVKAHPPTIPIVGVAGKTGSVVPPLPLTRANLIAAARRGCEFLLKHAVRPEDGHVYFALSREGRPAAMQRKPFSATFLIMALGETALATGDAALRAEALALFRRTLGWVRTPGALGKPALDGTPALEPLNVPMILLNVMAELRRSAPPAESLAEEAAFAELCAAEEARCVRDILSHVDDARAGVVLENVRPDGSFDGSSPDGRLTNPGHAIEAGWFLLAHARAAGDAALAARAVRVIDDNFAWGWDDAAASPSPAPGGLLYFRDIEGFSPTQLEWNMKLWWPHNEAMIGFAMAFQQTGDDAHWARFDKVASWAYAHLVDSAAGEWWGYADRVGVVTHRFKGGPYKGCFHVPRALLYVDRVLSAVLRDAEGGATMPA